MNAQARLQLIREALLAHSSDINHLPLHRQVTPWAMRAGVSAMHRADNFVIPYRVTIQ
jgi:peptide/nickel transport system substrate-binding protein